MRECPQLEDEEFVEILPTRVSSNQVGSCALNKELM